jgi:NADPH:quinone reductase-like Zn-dependent oxidoreductase
MELLYKLTLLVIPCQEAKIMKKVVISRHGAPEALKVVEAAVPTPRAGEALVRVRAAGVAWADTMARRGQYPTQNKIPYAPGYDVVGTVEALGEGVSSVSLGQSVAALLPQMGGYAEFVSIPAGWLVPVPAGLAPAEAVSVILNGLTAYAALHRVAKVRAGEKILVTSAAGGLGTLLIQLAKLAGLEVYGSASTGKLGLVSTLGATPIDYRAGDVAAQVQQLSGGVEVIIDTVGGSPSGLKALRNGGRLVAVGSLSFKDKSPLQMLGSLIGTGLQAAQNPGKKMLYFGSLPPFAEKNLQWYRETLDLLLGLAAEKKLKVILGQRLPLSEAAQAHALLEAGAVSGKIVLEV